MARMYAQRTEQSPREYFPVLAPHMSRIVSASQPSGKIMQPSTRHRAEGAPDRAHRQGQEGREKGKITSQSLRTTRRPPEAGPRPPALPINPRACEPPPVDPETLNPGRASCLGEQKLSKTQCHRLPPSNQLLLQEAFLEIGENSKPGSPPSAPFSILAMLTLSHPHHSLLFIFVIYSTNFY